MAFTFNLSPNPVPLSSMQRDWSFLDTLGAKREDRRAGEAAQQFASGLPPEEARKYAPLLQNAQTRDMALKEILARGRPTEQPSGVREYEYAKQQGYGGTFADWELSKRRAGATNVNTKVMGQVPPGYRVQYDDAGRPVSMEAIPGGPAAAEEAEAAAKASRQADLAGTTGDTITATTKQILSAIKGSALPATGLGGAAAAQIPTTGAADVRRRVDTLKSIAAAENINAMRQASPTGGALGNASDADITLLKNKAGALDPNAPQEVFERDLMDYTRTLYRVVHGVDAGDQIFNREFGQSNRGQPAAVSGQAPKRLRFNPATGDFE